MITWNQAKRARILVKHGLDFADLVDFDFNTAMITIDDREDYGELREIAIGWCGPRLCFLVFVRLDDDETRALSFRKATAQEARRYVQS